MPVSDQLYDCVALLEDEMADVLDAYAAFPSQTRARRDSLFSLEVVVDINAFVRDGTAIPWAKIAAFALVAGAQRAHPALFPDPESENCPDISGCVSLPLDTTEEEVNEIQDTWERSLGKTNQRKFLKSEDKLPF